MPTIGSMGWMRPGRIGRTLPVLRITRRVFTLVALAGVALAGGDVPAQQVPGFRVVVHPDSPVEALSADELSRMFLKRSTRWNDDTPVRAVDQLGDAPVREAFSQAVHGRSARAIVAHWQQQIFSGRAVPPPELASDDEVTSYVSTHPGAIGYVSSGGDVQEVKVVEIRR